MASQPETPDPGRDALGALPVPLWLELLRALRRASGNVGREELPVGLRPFAGWKPERLVDARARRAVTGALVDDPWLRDQVGEAIEPEQAWQEASEADPHRLAERHGEQVAVAALVARGRWDALAVLAAEAGSRRARLHQVAAQDSEREGPEESDGPDRAERWRQSLAEARQEQTQERRRAEAAEQRARDMAGERRRLVADLAASQEEVAALREELRAERARHRERLARLRRRVSVAEARAEAEARDRNEVASTLDALVRRTEAESEHAADAQAPQPAPVETAVPRVPRDARQARPGRPCLLPPGLGENDRAAATSLLQVPDIQVLLDGYNVTMSTQGRPLANLEDQRRWLLLVAAGVVARYRCDITVVFDGREARPGGLSAPRGVMVAFSDEDETADDRIVALVRNLDAEAPAVVVTNDRELRERVTAHRANVTGSATFLRAVGA